MSHSRRAPATFVFAALALCIGFAATCHGETRAILLVDNFEDCNVDGWTSAGGPCNALATNINPGGGVCSMEVDNDCGGQYNGWYYDLGPFPAETISVSLRSQNTSMLDAYFVVGEAVEGGFRPAIFMFASAIGYWVVAGTGGGTCGSPYTALQWYDFVITVHWTSKTFDVSRDGSPCLSGVSFLENASTFNQVHAYNLDDSAGWYDDIIMSTPPPQPPIFTDGFETGNTDNWSVTYP